jgi:hypothetical protein
MEEITQLLWQASQNRKACRIQMEGEPLTRVIHPYGIFRTSKNQIVLACWQVMGFTSATGKEGYRNLVLEDIEEVEMLDTAFQVHPDFNASSEQYKEWVYHV